MMSLTQVQKEPRMMIDRPHSSYRHVRAYESLPPFCHSTHSCHVLLLRQIYSLYHRGCQCGLITRSLQDVSAPRPAPLAKSYYPSSHLLISEKLTCACDYCLRVCVCVCVCVCVFIQTCRKRESVF